MNPSFTLSTEVQQLLTTEQAWHYGVIPRTIENGTVSLFIDELQWTQSAEDELELLLGKRVELEKSSSEHVRMLLSKYYLRHNADAGRSNTTRSLSAKQEPQNNSLHINFARKEGRPRQLILGYCEKSDQASAQRR